MMKKKKINHPFSFKCIASDQNVPMNACVILIYMIEVFRNLAMIFKVDIKIYHMGVILQYPRKYKDNQNDNHIDKQTFSR